MGISRNGGGEESLKFVRVNAGLKWCAQVDDLRTFLAEFVAIRPQAEIPTQIEALIH